MTESAPDIPRPSRARRIRSRLGAALAALLVVLLAFWGNWCPDCRAMFPYERSLVKRMENRPFALIGVNSDKDKAALALPQGFGWLADISC